MNAQAVLALVSVVAVIGFAFFALRPEKREKPSAKNGWKRLGGTKSIGNNEAGWLSIEAASAGSEHSGDGGGGHH